jgi:hypothetical protein
MSTSPYGASIPSNGWPAIPLHFVVVVHGDQAVLTRRQADVLHHLHTRRIYTLPRHRVKEKVPATL